MYSIKSDQLKLMDEKVKNYLESLKQFKAVKTYHESGNKMLTHLRELSSFLNNKDTIELFHQQYLQKFDSERKAMFAGEHISLMKLMLENNELISLENMDFSMLVTGYVLNLSPLLHGDGIFVTRNAYKNQANENQREEVCFRLAKNKRLVQKLNPAARMFLYSFLKHSKSLEKAGLSKEMLNEIQNSYDIITDYNPQKENGYWNKILWPAVAGNYGFGAFITRVEELYRAARGIEINAGIMYHHNKKGKPTQDEILANAEILVTDERFKGFMETRYKYSEKESKNHLLYLAQQYPLIAMLLILNKGYRPLQDDEKTYLNSIYGSQNLRLMQNQSNLLIIRELSKLPKNDLNDEDIKNLHCVINQLAKQGFNVNSLLTKSQLICVKNNFHVFPYSVNDKRPDVQQNLSNKHFPYYPYYFADSKKEDDTQTLEKEENNNIASP